MRVSGGGEIRTRRAGRHLRAFPFIRLEEPGSNDTVVLLPEKQDILSARLRTLSHRYQVIESHSDGVEMIVTRLLMIEFASTRQNDSVSPTTANTTIYCTSSCMA